MDRGYFTRATLSIIDAPRLDGSRNNPKPAKTSTLWVSMILHAMGEREWAEQYVQALPSPEEMHDDGARVGSCLVELVTAVRDAIWNNGIESIHLKQDDFRKVAGSVYITEAYQNKLIRCLEEKPSYEWVEAWIQSRYEKAKEARAQVHFPMHYSSSSQNSAPRPAAMLSRTLFAPVPYSLHMLMTGGWRGSRGQSKQ